MSENWSAQVSIKTPAGTLINLRGERGEHVEAQLDWVIKNAPQIVEAEKAFAAVAGVAQQLGGQVVQQQQQSWSNQGSQQQAPAAPAQGGGAPPPTKWDLSGPPTTPEQCIHGQMQWRHRVAKGSGKEYRGWFCSLPEAQGGCKAKFLK